MFSWEKDGTGKRSFIVTTYEEFWRQYEECIPAHRHYYEIVQEGWPCHLYFGVPPWQLWDHHFNCQAFLGVRSQDITRTSILSMIYCLQPTCTYLYIACRPGILKSPQSWNRWPRFGGSCHWACLLKAQGERLSSKNNSFAQLHFNQTEALSVCQQRALHKERHLRLLLSLTDKECNTGSSWKEWVHCTALENLSS